MGKFGKAQKKRKLNTSLESTLNGRDSVEICSDDELSVCAHVLHLLGTSVGAETFASRRCKSVRSALYALLGSGVLQQQSGGNGNVSGTINIPTVSQQIAESLRLGDWEIAIGLLRQLREKQIIPKLGSVCRWVRECDGVLNITDENLLKLSSLSALDAILRTADPHSVGSIERAGGQCHINGNLVHYSPWVPFENLALFQTFDQSEADKIELRSKFFPCFFEDSKDRNPVNEFNLTIYASKPNTIDLISFSDKLKIRKYDLPFINGAFLLADILSSQECSSIIKAGEAVGFDPDKPIGGSAVEKASILAHAFVWLADECFVETLWERVKALIPSSYGALGLNRRFRCYRYVPGAVYR